MVAAHAEQWAASWWGHQLLASTALLLLDVVVIAIAKRRPSLASCGLVLQLVIEQGMISTDSLQAPSAHL
jgi:hypothetical protein